jgi:hypothetical protein
VRLGNVGFEPCAWEICPGKERYNVFLDAGLSVWLERLQGWRRDGDVEIWNVGWGFEDRNVRFLSFVDVVFCSLFIYPKGEEF